MAFLRDIDGHEVLLKANVIFSSKRNRPILCYGRLMERGWGINGREQTLENGDLKAPLHLQNRSLTVQGHVIESFEMKMKELGGASS